MISRLLLPSAVRLAPQPPRVIPGYDQERRGVVGTDTRQRDQLRGGLRHQPIEVRL